MGSRYYDRTLECGCLISSDKGGGLMPCNYGYGCGKKGCDENNQCEDCIKQNKLCYEVWEKWKKTDDYKNHCKEVWERNNDEPYPEKDELTELMKTKLKKIENEKVFEGR